MPELPEVETVARGLRRIILGQTVGKIWVGPKARVFPKACEFAGLLTGSTVNAIRRRGKNILLDLSNGQTLWVHLKMTGHFYFLPESTPRDRHDHVILKLQDGDHQLRFNDYRRFGKLQLHPTDLVMQQKGLVELGPEPLEMTTLEFVSRLRSRTRMIKPALLDQALIAGLGNIYSDEVLHLARLHPRRITSTISPAKLGELHGHIQGILKKAIRLTGTSVDTFAGVNGRPGRFQKYLLVYGREGEPCRRCGRPIQRRSIGSRSAHFCPGCQRLINR